MQDYPHVLVATLGGQPQIITFTLDLLLQEGYPISEVFVLHPRAIAPSRLQRALVSLNAECTGKYYQEAQHTIHFHSCVLELDGKPIDDIIDDRHADGTLDTLHQLLGDLKHQGYHIHLSVSGGRRLMGLLAVAVAALNFDRYDHIWHLYTPKELQAQASEGAIMHVSSDTGIKLIKGPFIALGAYIQNPVRSFQIAQQEQYKRTDVQKHSQCQQVIDQLTPRELEVLQAFAKGLTPPQVSKELVISIKTVDHHKTQILDICRGVWSTEPNTRRGYHFLYRTFAPYFNSAEYTSTN